MDAHEPFTSLTQFRLAVPVDGYWRITFSNPPINLLNGTTVLELVQVIQAIEAADGPRVVVFDSDNPDFFWARYDLSDTSGVGFQLTDSGVSSFIESTIRLSNAAAISIASIRGRARGGGSEFALACDLRYASLENTLIGQPEVAAGIVPGGGGLERLPRLVGEARALEIIASGDDYDAATAERYGLVNRALPDGELDGYVDRLARRLASFDPVALAEAKRLVHRADREPPIEDYRETLAVVGRLISQPDNAERQARTRRYAAAVGADFELAMGHHLGVANAGPGFQP